MAEINLNTFQTQFQNFIKQIKTSGETNIEEKTFLEKVTNDRSIFEMLDQNGDGKISETEMQTVLQADSNNDGIVTEKELACMQEMKFFAKRGVDKWFSLDINRDGHWSNVETKLGEHRMWGDAEIYTGLDASMSNEQLAKLYNMEEKIEESKGEDIQSCLRADINDLKQRAKEQYGIELNDKQIIILKNEQKKQLNTWLFKTGDNAKGDAPLYNSLSNTAYTRLVTTEQTVSCCGGDIVPPPAAENKTGCSYVFSSLDTENGKNKAEEVKNRLAWAMFKTPPKEELALNAWDKMNDKEKAMYAERQEILNQLSNEELEKLLKTENEKECLAFEQQNNISHEDLEMINDRTLWVKMSDEIYNNYHRQYQQMRNMKSSDFRELLKPENEQKRMEFEKHSTMSVKQIVDYIDIVEKQIGVGNFDKEDWSVSAEQYNKIVIDINGTTDDETRLQGKTRADVPENRQALLRFLEEKGWLYDQFK